ncbi:putative phage holin [Rhodococcus rhodnii]|uniref:Uncharacterized protein n=2 Tax=Rhodococcus rhodnii TaxID=38312 RepID=R7WRG9_9NOCA|nr:hypothetical protein [Rhodococcus rhodnii]EOM77891.1 hypothetical protein Rrhod_0700 [Rhodococcus rhodnii LMG 5362]
MRDLANIALLVLAVMVAAFTIRYAIWSPWWTNRIGRIYLAKSVVLSFVLTQAAFASIVAADYLGRQQIRFSIYLLGVLIYVPMLWSLIREQRADRAALKLRGSDPGGDT